MPEQLIAPTNTTRVVELTDRDVIEVGRLAASVLGWHSDRSNSDSYWRWRVEQNPARTGDEPLGWGLRESNGGLVGVLLNVPQSLCYDGRLITAYASSTYIVAPDFRQKGLLLAHTFAGQKGPALLLNTTANPTVRRIFLHFGFSELPSWEELYYWILDPIQLGASFLLSKRNGSTLSKFFGGISKVNLSRHFPMKIGWPKKSSHYCVEPVERVNSEFDELWEELKSDYELTTARAARFVSWRFIINPLEDRRSRLLVARDGFGKLRGYVAWRRFDQPELLLKRARILDLFASQDEPDVVDALLSAALTEAKSDGVAVVEIHHAGKALRQHLKELGAFRRRSKSGAYLVKWNIMRPLADMDKWHTSAIDGDFAM